ncbi:unnamed protein product [Trifolium pratense]|uniref:Uncharacterized protein n=1 Tax=Trifolium pratense TaxID=57577 RepID=A0ACB0JBU3_TRIPR|nr:unnamed protein product [Trifolium pratense]
MSELNPLLHLQFAYEQHSSPSRTKQHPPSHQNPQRRPHLQFAATQQHPPSSPSRTKQNPSHLHERRTKTQRRPHLRFAPKTHQPSAVLTFARTSAVLSLNSPPAPSSLSRTLTPNRFRILRDRALYKVTSDFVDAAINGAVGVISGCIPPINPTDPECFHMYVHNNIFFSFSIDADLEKLSKKHGDGNSKTCCTGTLQSSSDKASYVRPHGDSLVPNGGKTDGSSLEDVNSTETTQDVSPEAQLAENEQATYASANNDLKGTKAYQEADVPGLYNLAMAIIDYRGHRVVAQVFDDPTSLTEEEMYELRNNWATCFLDLYNPEVDYVVSDDEV